MTPEAIITEAHEHWIADNRPLELGRVLYDNLPAEQRPLWAASILRLVLSRVQGGSEVQDIIQIAETPSRWGEALQSIQTLHGVTLRDRNVVYNDTLALAEKVAKVTHNASAEHDPFAHEIGWKLIADLHNIINHINDDQFTAQVWDVLIAPYRE